MNGSEKLKKKLFQHFQRKSYKMTAPSEWVTFFEDAGIPQSVATKYGVAFSENRISMTMLGDLNKVKQYSFKLI